MLLLAPDVSSPAESASKDKLEKCMVDVFDIKDQLSVIKVINV